MKGQQRAGYQIEVNDLYTQYREVGRKEGERVGLREAKVVGYSFLFDGLHVLS